MESAIGAALGAAFWVLVFWLLDAHKKRRNSRADRGGNHPG